MCNLVYFGGKNLLQCEDARWSTKQALRKEWSSNLIAFFLLAIGMFDSLPLDLYLHILVTWLDADLVLASKLDVAICNHSMRPDHLTALAHIGRYDRPVGTTHPANRLVNYLQWIASRKVLLSELTVDLADMEDAVAPLGFTQFPSFDNIHFTTRYADQVDEVVFALFMSKFPSVKAFGGWPKLNCRHLTALRHLGFQLEYLNLSACDSVSTIAVAALLASVAPSLVEYFDVFRADVMVRLQGHTFPKLNGISLSKLDDGDQLHCIASFCCSASTTLQLLILKGPSQQDRIALCLTAELAHSIAQTCKNLHTVYFYCSADVEPLAVRSFMTNCPHLGLLRTNERNTIITRLDYEVGIVDDSDNTLIDVILDVVRAPLKRFQATYLEFSFHQFCDLAAKFGPALEGLCMSFSLPETAAFSERPDVRIPHFTKLEVLTLVCFHSITQASFELLPIYCPNLTSFRLYSSDNALNDHGACAILEAHKHAMIKELRFQNCTLLTDVTLYKILELFPVLDVVDITGTAVNKETVLKLVLEETLSVDALEYHEHAWIRSMLEAEGYF